MTNKVPAGLVRTVGTGTATEAADRLVAAIEANENLRLVARVDHSASAANIGLDLEPTIEIMFGNPALGTPLMQQNRTVGIDLPQRMLILETDGALEVFHNDPAALGERHSLPSDMPQLATITKALQRLAALAAGTSS